MRDQLHETFEANGRAVDDRPVYFVSPLRDLIAKIDDLAQGHLAYSQAADAIRNLRDHLSAIARCEEINRNRNQEKGH